MQKPSDEEAKRLQEPTQKKNAFFSFSKIHFLFYFETRQSFPLIAICLIRRTLKKKNTMFNT